MPSLIIVDTASICCKTIEVVPGSQGVDPHLDGLYGKYTMELNEGTVQFVSDNKSVYGSVTIRFGAASSVFRNSFPGMGKLNWHFEFDGQA